MVTTTEDNKQIILSLFENVLNNRNWELLPNLVSDEYIGVQGSKGVEAFKAPVTTLIDAFPNIQWQVLDVIEDGDKVAVHWKVKGTHEHLWLSIPPTGKTASNQGMGIFSIKNGKVVSSRLLTDRLGFLQELDVIPDDVSSLGDSDDHVIFIDSFLVPGEAKNEFLERVSINRNFIKTLPGFIRDAAYESTDKEGNVKFVTVAVWKSSEALENAKQAVQAEYKKEGFNPAAMMERLNTTMERGLYKVSDL